MPVEIVGLVNHNSGSMLAPRPLSSFEPDFIAKSAQVQEAAGYDRVLIANTAVMPDALNIGTYVANNTKTLKLMIAQRPGFIAPTMAARMMATIDRLSGGRAGLHIIAGANDQELQADGDFLTKDERYHRALEYVTIIKRLWQASEPLDHDGRYYKFNRAFVEVKPSPGGIPVFWGGSSELALDFGAQCADIYALTGDALAGAGELVTKARAYAEKAGRMLDFLLTLIIVLGDTEEKAWANAGEILEGYKAVQAARAKAAPLNKGPTAFADKPVATGFSRLLESAERGERLDKCFWTGMNKATGARQGNQSTLVGTVEQVADALMDYYDIGISRFLLRGYRPLADAELMGRELIPLVRKLALERDANRR